MSKQYLDPPLLYARCWEDSNVLRLGLQISSGGDVLSIASAGDNSFELLLDDPKRVVVIDRNQTQLALIRLKMAAIEHLAPDKVRRFLGIDTLGSQERWEIYQELRSHLSPNVCRRWDQARPVIEAGVANTGKFERYLSLFRQWILPWVQWPSTVRRMTLLDDLSQQQALYNDAWDSWRWRTLFRMFFSRRVMEKRGREKAFFDQVEARNIGDIFRLRAEKALCRMPVRTNPYLRWILDGTNLIPPYLSDDLMPIVRERLKRIEIVEADLIDYLKSTPARTFTAYNFSDCLEYMPSDVADDLLRVAVAASKDNARLVYWNLLVERDGSNVTELVSETDFAESLFVDDRAFFYSRLVVERVER